jgi:hypothetical protein
MLASPAEASANASYHTMSSTARNLTGGTHCAKLSATKIVILLSDIKMHKNAKMQNNNNNIS